MKAVFFYGNKYVVAKRRVGRPSLFTEEMKERLLNTIVATGSEKAAYLDAGINHSTYFDWKNKFPDFSEAVAKAKVSYASQCPQYLVDAAKNAVANAILNGVTEVWTNTETKYDGSGNVLETKESVKKVNKGAPEWAISRVLGSADVIDALQVLIANNLASTEESRIISEGFEEIRKALKAKRENNG